MLFCAGEKNMFIPVPFERELLNKIFICPLSVPKVIHCLLEGICNMQSRTGVAKHIAGVKEVQGGE